MVQASDKMCPKCGSLTMKSWDELTEDEQFLAKRLPMSAEYTPPERKKHRFCTRCWFESVEQKSDLT